jgi:hypothetical protein
MSSTPPIERDSISFKKYFMEAIICWELQNGLAGIKLFYPELRVGARDTIYSLA